MNTLLIHSDNTLTGVTLCGVLIDQSYPYTLGVLALISKTLYFLA